MPSQKLRPVQKSAPGLLDNFSLICFLYAWIVPLWADQLLPQLLMEQFDNLPLQCRHIEHTHEGVWFGKNNF